MWFVVNLWAEKPLASWMQRSIAHKKSHDTKHPHLVASSQARDDDEKYTCLKNAKADNYAAVSIKSRCGDSMSASF